jgi:hypothetical protein
MKKISKILAAGITALIAVSMFAAPASAVEVPLIEDSMCAVVNPQIAALADIVSDGDNSVDELLAALGVAKTDLEGSSGILGTTGLDFVKALDGVGNVNGTADAFTEAAIAFSEDVTAWVDAVDALYPVVMDQGLNEAVLSYLNGLCGIL